MKYKIVHYSVCLFLPKITFKTVKLDHSCIIGLYYRDLWKFLKPKIFLKKIEAGAIGLQAIEVSNSGDVIFSSAIPSAWLA